MAQERGAALRAHDPAAMASAAAVSPRWRCARRPMTQRPGPSDDNGHAVAGVPSVNLAHVAKAMRGDVLLDGRNLYDPAAVFAAGLRYEGMGRGGLPPAEHRTRRAPP